MVPGLGLHLAAASNPDRLDLGTPGRGIARCVDSPMTLGVGGLPPGTVETTPESKPRILAHGQKPSKHAGPSARKCWIIPP